MPNIKRFRLDWLFSIFVAAALLGLITWATMGEIARNPTRVAMVELSQDEMVKVQFETDPYPAQSMKPVSLNFMIMNSRDQTIQPDFLSFEFGRKGSDQPVGSGTIQPMLEGNGMLMTNTQFPSAGAWWLRVRFAKDGNEKDVEFTIDVKPAQE